MCSARDQTEGELHARQAVPEYLQPASSEPSAQSAMPSQRLEER